MSKKRRKEEKKYLYAELLTFLIHTCQKRYGTLSHCHISTLCPDFSWDRADFLLLVAQIGLCFGFSMRQMLIINHWV